MAQRLLTVSAPQDRHDYISSRLTVARISVLRLILLACFTKAMQSQAPAPKLDPEMKKSTLLVSQRTAKESTSSDR